MSLLPVFFFFSFKSACGPLSFFSRDFLVALFTASEGEFRVACAEHRLRGPLANETRNCMEEARFPIHDVDVEGAPSPEIFRAKKQKWSLNRIVK